MDFTFYLFLIIAFVAVILFLVGGYMIWYSHSNPESIRVENRLRSGGVNEEVDSADIKLVKQRSLSGSSVLERLLIQLPYVDKLDQLLIQSGVSFRVATFLGYTVLTTLGGLILGLYFSFIPLILALLVVIMGALPISFVLYVRNKRMLKIEEQLPEAIDLMARALKAGHAFNSALKMVVTEASDPIASEFRLTFDEVNYGISMSQALKNLSQRIPSTDLRFFVIAVLVQRDSGGNLTELLESISNLIRLRLKLLGAIRVMSAEGRLSAWILSGLPFVLAYVIHLTNPEFLAILYTDPMGEKMIYGALVIMAIGIFIMSRIVKIRV